jgi:hypothetical protein
MFLGLEVQLSHTVLVLHVQGPEFYPQHCKNIFWGYSLLKIIQTYSFIVQIVIIGSNLIYLHSFGAYNLLNFPSTFMDVGLICIKCMLQDSFIFKIFIFPCELTFYIYEIILFLVNFFL